jgi:Leucine Rich repeat
MRVIPVVASASLLGVPTDILKTIVSHFDTLNDLATFNLTSTLAYESIKSILEFKNLCQTSYDGTWPNLVIDTENLQDPSNCLKHINKLLFIYKRVHINGPADQVAAFISLISTPPQVIDQVTFDLSFPRGTSHKNVGRKKINNNGFISAEELALVFEAAGAKKLDIDLFSHPISNRVSKALAKYLQSSSIQALKLGGIQLDSRHMTSLIKLLPVSNISKLSVTKIPFGEGIPEWIELFAETLNQTSLRHVDLSSNSLQPDEAITLFSAISSASKLQSLNVAKNMLGVPGIEALIEHLPRSNIMELDLSSTYGHVISPVIDSLPLFTSLRRLGLRANLIDDEDVESLSTVLRHTNLTELDISQNYITEMGIRELAAGVSGSKLKRLNVMSSMNAGGYDMVLENAMPPRSKLILEYI